MHPNYSEFLRFLLKNGYYKENECYKCGGLVQYEHCQNAEDTVGMEQKQNIDKYSTEEIFSDFLNNF